MSNATRPSPLRARIPSSAGRRLPLAVRHACRPDAASDPSGESSSPPSSSPTARAGSARRPADAPDGRAEAVGGRDARRSLADAALTATRVPSPSKASSPASIPVRDFAGGRSSCTRLPSGSPDRRAARARPSRPSGRPGSRPGRARRSRIRLPARAQRNAPRHARDGDVAVPGHRREQTAARREGEAARPARVERADLLAGGELPDAHDPVGPGERDERAVGAERAAVRELQRRRAARRPAEPGQRPERLAVARAPHASVAGVPDTEHEAAVGAERDVRGSSRRACRPGSAGRSTRAASATRRSSRRSGRRG